MTTKEYLSRYSNLIREINAKREQLEYLQEQVNNIPSPELRESRVTKISDRTGNTATNIVRLERELSESIDKLMELQREIRQVIDSVEDVQLRLLLELRYINNKTWEQVAEELGFTYQWVHVLHKRALNKIKTA